MKTCKMSYLVACLGAPMKFGSFDSYEEFHKFQLVATNDVAPLIVIVEYLHIRNQDFLSIKKH